VGGFPGLPGATTNPRSSMLLGYGMSRPAAECLRVAAGLTSTARSPRTLTGWWGGGSPDRTATVGLSREQARALPAVTEADRGRQRVPQRSRSADADGALDTSRRPERGVGTGRMGRWRFGGLGRSLIFGWLSCRRCRAMSWSCSCGVRMGRSPRRLGKLEHLLSRNSGRELDLDLAHAAIDAEVDACDEAALLGGQEVGGGGHFLGLSHSGERNG
jgi:hypothetical protein